MTPIRRRGERGQAGGMEVLPFGLLVFVAGTLLLVNIWGVVDTKFAAAVLKNDALLDEVLRMTPMKRYAQPDEIAGAALYLASDSASYLTGQAIVIDGGMTIA